MSSRAVFTITGLLLAIEEATFDPESNERFIWEVKKNTINTNTKDTIAVVGTPFFNMVLLRGWSTARKKTVFYARGRYLVKKTIGC